MKDKTVDFICMILFLIGVGLYIKLVLDPEWSEAAHKFLIKIKR